MWYDVKADLLNEFQRDGKNRPFVNLFVNTHPHDDHTNGFEDNFYKGKPEHYNDDTDKDKILMKC